MQRKPNACSKKYFYESFTHIKFKPSSGPSQSLMQGLRHTKPRFDKEYQESGIYLNYTLTNLIFLKLAPAIDLIAHQNQIFQVLFILKLLTNLLCQLEHLATLTLKMSRIFFIRSKNNLQFLKGYVFKMRMMINCHLEEQIKRHQNLVLNLKNNFGCQNFLSILKIVQFQKLVTFENIPKEILLTVLFFIKKSFLSKYHKGVYHHKKSIKAQQQLIH